ncbi:conserved hypothetical protein [Neospora caninum Liverpool]|uniref:C2HC/C3H-type domain-containing protein n=1 Tax=Neospora caninum (strain Liverpool) TaxID=572307 RepID=F0VKP7_NEOCL|nr:conserved hypothetical protein [Neospora caninum Liverpool]CBZ54648.1 conserved hypothetical protein [Neospora caninum Liverpool]CEL69364.1 TPA: hypothetical protein BN1204_050760 [Neospora caninum Liverpool]|eukprot:XP_003884678.1 conserved hypothetical protein [Neospora caninum Liverpool]
MDEDSTSRCPWERVGPETTPPESLPRGGCSAHLSPTRQDQDVPRSAQDAAEPQRLQGVACESGTVPFPFSPSFGSPHSLPASSQPDACSPDHAGSTRIPQFHVRRVPCEDDQGDSREGRESEEQEHTEEAGSERRKVRRKDGEDRENASERVRENGAQLELKTTAPHSMREDATTTAPHEEARQDLGTDGALSVPADEPGAASVRSETETALGEDLSTHFSRLSLNHGEVPACGVAANVAGTSRAHVNPHSPTSGLPTCSLRLASGLSASGRLEQSRAAFSRLHDLAEPASTSTGHEDPQNPACLGDTLPARSVSSADGSLDEAFASSEEGGHHAAPAPRQEPTFFSAPHVPLVPVGMDFSEEKDALLAVPAGLRTPSSFSGRVSQQHRPGAFALRPEEVPLFDTQINSFDDFLHAVEQKEQEEATRTFLDICGASEREGGSGDNPGPKLDDELRPCSLCKRSFAAWRLPRHVQACARARDARLAFLRRQRAQNPRASKPAGSSGSEAASLHEHGKKARSTGSAALAVPPQGNSQAGLRPVSIQPSEAAAADPAQSGDFPVPSGRTSVLVEAVQQLTSSSEREAERSAEDDARREAERGSREGNEGLVGRAVQDPTAAATCEAFGPQADGDKCEEDCEAEETERVGEALACASFEAEDLLDRATLPGSAGSSGTACNRGTVFGAVSSACFASREASRSVSPTEGDRQGASLCVSEDSQLGGTGDATVPRGEDSASEEIDLAAPVLLLPSQTDNGPPVAVTVFARSSAPLSSLSASVSSDGESGGPQAPQCSERLSPPQSGAGRAQTASGSAAEGRFLEEATELSLPHFLDVQATLAVLPLPWEVEGERWEPEELETKVCTEEDETDLAMLHSPKMHGGEGLSLSLRGSAKVVCSSSHSCTPPSRSPSEASRQASRLSSSSPTDGDKSPGKKASSASAAPAPLRRGEARRSEEPATNLAGATESVPRKSSKPQRATAPTSPRTQKPATHVYSHNPTEQTAKRDGLRSVRPEDRWKIQPTATCPFCSRSFCVKRYEGHVQVCQRLRFTRPAGVAKKASAQEVKSVEAKKAKSRLPSSESAKRIPIWMRGAVAKGQGEEKPEGKRSVSAAARRADGAGCKGGVSERRDCKVSEERDRAAAAKESEKPGRAGTERDGKRPLANGRTEPPRDGDSHEMEKPETVPRAVRGASCGAAERLAASGRRESGGGPRGDEPQSKRSEAASAAEMLGNALLCGTGGPNASPGAISSGDPSSPSLGRAKRESPLPLVPLQQGDMSLSPFSTAALSEALLEMATEHPPAEARVEQRRHGSAGENRVPGQRLSPSGLIRDLVFQLVMMGVQAAGAERAAEDSGRSRQPRSQDSPFVSGSRSASGARGWPDLVFDVVSRVQENPTDSEASDEESSGPGRAPPLGWTREPEGRSLEGGQPGESLSAGGAGLHLCLEGAKRGRQTSGSVWATSGREREFARDGRERNEGAELNGLPWGLLPRERSRLRKEDQRDADSREVDSGSRSSSVSCEMRLAGGSCEHSVASLVDSASECVPGEADSEDEAALLGASHHSFGTAFFAPFSSNEGLVARHDSRRLTGPVTAKRAGTGERGSAGLWSSREGRGRSSDGGKVKSAPKSVVQRNAIRRIHQGHVSAETPLESLREEPSSFSQSSGEDTDAVLPGPDLVQGDSKGALKDLLRRSRMLLKQARALEPPSAAQVERRGTGGDMATDETARDAPDAGNRADGDDAKVCTPSGTLAASCGSPSDPVGCWELLETGAWGNSQRAFSGREETGAEACSSVAHSSPFQQRTVESARNAPEDRSASEDPGGAAVDGDLSARARSADSEARRFLETEKGAASRSPQKRVSTASHLHAASLSRADGDRAEGKQEDACAPRRLVGASSRQTASGSGAGSVPEAFETGELPEISQAVSRAVDSSLPRPAFPFSSREASVAFPPGFSAGACGRPDSRSPSREACCATRTGSVPPGDEVLPRRHRRRISFEEATDFAARDRPGSPPQLNGCADARLIRGGEDEERSFHHGEAGRRARREIERQSSGSTNSAFSNSGSEWSRRSSCASRSSSVSSQPGDVSPPRSFVESPPRWSSAEQPLDVGLRETGHPLLTSRVSSFLDEFHQNFGTPRLPRESRETGGRSRARESLSRSTATAAAAGGGHVRRSSAESRPEGGVSLGGRGRDHFLPSSWQASQMGETEPRSRNSQMGRGLVARGEEHIPAARPPQMLVGSGSTRREQAKSCTALGASGEPSGGSQNSGGGQVHGWRAGTQNLARPCQDSLLAGDSSATLADANFALRNTVVPQPFQPPQLGGGGKREERTVRYPVADQQSLTGNEASRARAVGSSLFRVAPVASQVAPVGEGRDGQAGIPRADVSRALSDVHERGEPIKVSAAEHPSVVHFRLYPEPTKRELDARHGSAYNAPLSHSSSFLSTAAPSRPAVTPVCETRSMYGGYLPTCVVQNETYGGELYSKPGGLSVAGGEQKSGVPSFSIAARSVAVPPQPLADVSSSAVGRPNESSPAPGASGFLLPSDHAPGNAPVMHWELNLRTGQWRSQSGEPRRGGSSLRVSSAGNGGTPIPVPGRTPEPHAAGAGTKSRPLGGGSESNEAARHWKGVANCGTSQLVSMASLRTQEGFLSGRGAPQATLAAVRAVSSAGVARSIPVQEPSPLQRQLQQRLLASKSNRWDVAASRSPPEATGSGRGSSAWRVPNPVDEQEMQRRKDYLQWCNLSVVSQPIVCEKATEAPTSVPWPRARFAGGTLNAAAGCALPQTWQGAAGSEQKGTSWLGAGGSKMPSWGGARLSASHRVFLAEH